MTTVTIDATRISRGPWVIRQKRPAGTSGTRLAMSEVPWLVTTADNSREFVAGAWTKEDAEFIVLARAEWPALDRELKNRTAALAGLESECKKLRDDSAAAAAELALLRPRSAAALTMLARILGTHHRGHDWALPWDEIQRMVADAGISDWRGNGW